MKKSALFLFLLLVFHNFLYAQASPGPTIEWQKCLGGGYLDYGQSIEPTTDGGYIIAGYTWGPGGDISGYHGNSESGDYWVAKLNSTGVIQWSKCLGGIGFEGGVVVHQAPDGGYVVAGEAGSLPGDGDVTTTNHGGSDYWIVKLSATGSILWQKSVGGEKNEYLYAFQFTPDGGYILAGETESSSGDVSGNHGSRDCWIVKLNSARDIEWQKCFGGSQEDEAYGVQALADGTYIIAGYTNSNDGNIIGNHGQSDAWVAKLDNGGNLLWSKCLGGTLREQAYDVVTTPDGGYLLAGYADSQDGDVTGNHATPGWSDFWAVKLDNTGTIQWQKCYGGGYNEQAYSVANTPDGGYLLAGYAQSLDGDVTCNTNIYSTGWVIKISSTGTLLWEKVLGGDYYDEENSVRPTPDGGCIVAGYTGSKDLPGYHTDISPSHSVGDFYAAKLAAPTITTGTSTLTIDPPPLNICSGSSVSLHTTGTNLSPDATYQWTRNGVSVGTNASSYTASNFINGDQVYCSVTSAGLCDMSSTLTSNTVALNVSPLVQPAVQITADALVVCSGGTLNFSAAVSNGSSGPNYQWEVNGQSTGSNSPSYAGNNLHNGDIVSCVYSDNTACAMTGANASNTIIVQIIPAATPSVSITASATKICAGSPVSFTAKAVNGGTAPAFQWQVNGGPAGTNSTVYSSSSLSDGDVVSCVLSSSAACATPVTAPSNPIALKVNAVKTSSLAIDYSPAVICSDKPVVFTAATVNEGASPVYQWLVNGGPVGTNSAVYSSSSLSDGDVVTCQLSDPADCITPSSGSVAPVVYSSPHLSPGPPVILAKGQSISLDLSVTGDISSYLWSPSTGLSDPTIPDPVASPLKTTTYTLEVSSPEGCKASGSILVSVFSKLAIPNAFTPNGDGRNDVFYVIGGPLGSVIKEFTVFNRWGQKIFLEHNVAPDDPRYGWNGASNGAEAPTGSYVYEIVMGFADGTQQVYQGTVVLVR